MSARFRPLILALILAVAARSLCLAAPFVFEATPGQLPKNVIPHHYSVRIVPDLHKFTTRGSVEVDIEVVKPVSQISLNALDLVATGATLSDGYKELQIKPKVNARKQTIEFKLAEPLKRGRYKLRIDFEGQITEQAQGLFYVKYAAPSGEKVLLGTEMEPSDARRMFPCWDEPVFRATFDLSAVLPENFKAVSNMPIEQESPLPGRLKEVRFARTPSMSTYLVVLVAGELEEVRDKIDGVDIGVITTEGKKEHGRYALAATKELLHYYNQYFGIKYPLPKLDQIAIPGGFSGAMENWGGITYNESELLFDPGTSPEQTRRDVFVFVAHEMSHQWFGNLVTAAWWNDLWLNEGFATWMENKATDHFNPDWQMWLAAAIDKSSVMSSDARKATHAIQQKVENESEANDAFDSVTYQKGGAVLRMFEAYLGEEQFRRGVHRYLLAHRYSNATTADLWDSLEKSSGKPIRPIAAGWTEQPGLPLVKVSEDCVDGRQVIKLQQERFTVEDSEAQPLSWTIPIGLVNVSRSNNLSQVLLTGKSSTVQLGKCSDLIKANAADTGYFRVLYDPATAAQLSKRMTLLAPSDRLNLLNDSWAMAEAGRESIADWLALAVSVRNEKSFTVTDQIISKLMWLDGLEHGLPGRKNFRARARSVLKPVLQRVGWSPISGEHSNDTLLRGRIIAALGHFEDQDVINEAKSRFEQFLRDPASLSPDLRPAVMETAGRYADESIFRKLHELARRSAGVEERHLYYGAMAQVLDPGLAKAVLDISLTDELAPQEAANLVTQSAESGKPELAWNFAQTNIRQLLAKVDSFERNNYLPSIARAFSDASRAEELLALVKKAVSDEAAAKAGEAAEGIRFKSAFKQRELPAVDNWSVETAPE